MKKQNLHLKIERKHIAILITIGFVLSMLPIFYLAGFDRASGDDWGYGLLTHKAWLESHSLGEVIKAGFATVKNYYYSWQGTWFSVFLFSLQPEVFSHQAYWVVPYLMVGLLIISMSWCLYELLVRKFCFTVRDYWLINMVILLLVFQFSPSKKSMIYWYNGTVHYVIPMVLALLSIACFLRYIEVFQMRYIICSSITMTLLGGMSYLAAFFAPLILILLMVEKYNNIKKIWALGIPFLLEAIGLIISAMAPGNAVRGGDSYEVSLSRAIWAIGKSFEAGTKGLADYIVEYPITIAVLLFLAVIIWHIQMRQQERRYPLPGLVLFYLYGTYCAMYWPEIFSGCEVSGGVPNTIYQVFVIDVVVSMIYLFGWVASVFSRKEKLIGAKIYYAVFLLAGIIAVLGRADLKDSTDYMIYEYVVTGQAADYKAQMEEFTKLLTENAERNIVLPMINDWQGPLMHMPVTEDPNAWTSTTVAGFFIKDSVRAIPRTEWEAMYK